MNEQDLKELTENWHSDTNWLNEKIDEHFKGAQDHAYALGLKRGLLDAQCKILPEGEWPKCPSPYQGEDYIGYSRTDLLVYARQVLSAHGIK